MSRGSPARPTRVVRARPRRSSPSPRTSRCPPRARASRSAGPRVGRSPAADYAHTTNQSASTTAVIPAVKDKFDKLRDKGRPAKAASPSAAGSVARRCYASLRLTHIETWSVTRMAFAISVAMMIVSVVAVTIFWVVLEVGASGTRSTAASPRSSSDDPSSVQHHRLPGLRPYGRPDASCCRRSTWSS